MPRAKTLSPLLVFVDRDLNWTGEPKRQLSKELRKGTVIKCFRDANKAWSHLNATDLDPYLLITDTVGTGPPVRGSLAKKVRVKFPRTRIILYSSRPFAEDVVKLQNDDRVIDRYVPKKSGDPSPLLTAAKESFSYYDQDPILNDMREYVSKSRTPKEPFVIIDGKSYSLYSLYWEMSRRTSVGVHALRTWAYVIASEGTDWV